MTKRLLIDARQTEETRVVLLSGTRIEDFDYEAENRKQLKGNVYLARVTRVEPSLQAAFVEYGGNRQGFLAFSEIHPDYYRIPIEDREALIAAEQSENEEDDDEASSEGAPETVGGEGGDDEDIRPRRQVRKYKIQEVVSRKQIMLVQVVKEERGNKGAALTTYLSLAGRYCVLMPNSNRGGGVSRKITNIADRKRLKTVVGGLDVATGMAVIVRTAGAKRTKTEIARDYAYLSKLWDDIRSRTLESQAPSVIHEEGNLIKRSIRDLYTSEVDEILVEGEEAYKTARTQMKMLIPSHVKKVVKYEDVTPIFQRYQVESQMDTIQSPQVTLKSGGYLVINQTEALVAVDVNSGRSTRERNIEETALKTNLEAAEELARQLRLRDLSGLIVVDFIDMEESRNRHAVERKMKDSMRNDRARIQIGGISHFGLLEMSRQRLRLSIGESISNLCPHCEGTGRIRSIDTAGLQMLRAIEEEAQKGKMDELHVTVHRDVALYILNHKRAALAELEGRYSLTIVLLSDDTLIAPDYKVERVGWQGKSAPQRNNRNDGRNNAQSEARKPSTESDEAEDEAENQTPGIEDAANDDEQPKRRKRGRRGGRRRRRRNGEEAQNGENGSGEKSGENGSGESSGENTGSSEGSSDASDNAEGSEATGDAPKKSRRSRGRRRSNNSPAQVGGDEAANSGEQATANSGEQVSEAASARNDTAEAGETQKPKSRSRKKAAPDAVSDADDNKAVAKKPATRGRKKASGETADDASGAPSGDASDAPSGDASDEREAKTVAKKAPAAAKAAKKPAAKKAAAKAAPKAAKKAAKKAPAAAKTAKKAPKADAKKAGDSDDWAPVSSAPQDVVEVGSAPASGRKGWWNRG